MPSQLSLMQIILHEYICPEGPSGTVQFHMDVKKYNTEVKHGSGHQEKNMLRKANGFLNLGGKVISFPSFGIPFKRSASFHRIVNQDLLTHSCENSNILTFHLSSLMSKQTAAASGFLLKTQTKRYKTAH